MVSEYLATLSGVVQDTCNKFKVQTRLNEKQYK